MKGSDNSIAKETINRSFFGYRLRLLFSEGIMTLIKLTSKDNKVFEVDLQIWKRSKLIQNLIENCGDVKEGETIPLLTVHSSVLEMVIKYATHHKVIYLFKL